MGTLVLVQDMKNSHQMSGKLDKKWLGPYEVFTKMSKETYQIQSKDGIILKKFYNTSLLKEYYLQEQVFGQICQ